jgi:hypothetical protein
MSEPLIVWDSYRRRWIVRMVIAGRTVEIGAVLERGDAEALIKEAVVFLGRPAERGEA